jgi:Tol biopolymer transport system component
MVDVSNERIVYAGGDGIYTVDLQGQNTRLIQPGNDLHHPRWAPTGDAILFTGADHFLYVIDLHGNQATVIPNTSGAQHFAVFKAANSRR